MIDDEELNEEGNIQQYTENFSLLTNSKYRDLNKYCAMNDLLKGAYREAAESSYKVAVIEEKHRSGQPYIYDNQKHDAVMICSMLTKDNVNVVSVQKKTKVGADGLFIELMRQFATHIDDNVIVDPKNMRLITGMSNKRWETQMKEKVPLVFRDQCIFHHGQLKKSNLNNIKNGLIIIDEIDSGDRIHQVLQKVLKDGDLLDAEKLKANNNKLVFISATLFEELHELKKWGDLHKNYVMTIPENYIGHQDFLDRGIIKEFYPLNTVEKAEKWIKEDIIDNYCNDYRIHIVRVTKNRNAINEACVKHNVDVREFDFNNPIDLEKLFEEELTRHIVITVKQYLRRANLLENKWKLRIGAVHEYYQPEGKVDFDVQIQGLSGRMNGYWKDIIDSGHKTGPYRMSTEAVRKYEAIYKEPFGNSSYQKANWKKTNDGEAKCNKTKPSLLNPKYVKNIQYNEEGSSSITKQPYRIYDNEDIVKNVFKELNDIQKSKKYTFSKSKFDLNERGFYITSLSRKKDSYAVYKLDDIIKTLDGENNGYNIPKNRRTIPCYKVTTDKSTLRYVVLFHNYTNPDLENIDKKFPQSN